MSRPIRMLLAAFTAICTIFFLLTAAQALTPSHQAVPSSTCHGGDIASGTYNKLVIDGWCNVPDDRTIVVRGSLVLREDGVFNAITLADVKIYGNVYVGRNASFGLGCTVLGVGCAADTHDLVTGSIYSNHGLNLLLDGNRINGSVIQKGGGPGVNCDVVQPLGRPANFVVKDNIINGRVDVDGWQGCWLGYIRNTTRGSVEFEHNQSADPDSTEIVSNRIWGSLDCSGNSPVTQFGDAGGTPNKVLGKVGGECRAVSTS